MKFRIGMTNEHFERDFLAQDWQYLSDAIYFIETERNKKGFNYHFLWLIIMMVAQEHFDENDCYYLEWIPPSINVFAEDFMPSNPPSYKTFKKYIGRLVEEDILIRDRYISKYEDYYFFHPMVYEKAKELKLIGVKKFG